MDIFGTTKIAEGSSMEKPVTFKRTRTSDTLEALAMRWNAKTSCRVPFSVILRHFVYYSQGISLKNQLERYPLPSTIRTICRVNFCYRL